MLRQEDDFSRTWKIDAPGEPTEIIAKHTGRIYRVYMLGFVPGFAYMGRVDPSITVPRHRVPRERVPAGSVGIAGIEA